MFFRPLIADAGVNQNPFLTRFYEQTVHVHKAAVLFIRRAYSRPKSARHNAKHRAPVQPKFTIRNYLDAIVTKPHRLFINVFSQLWVPVVLWLQAKKIAMDLFEEAEMSVASVEE